MSAKKQPNKEDRNIAKTDKQSTLAIALTTTGTLLATLSSTILSSTPLTALGISTIIIGATTYAIAKEQPKIPPQTSTLLLQTSTENTALLIEEIGINNKAIYLPSTITDDKPKALIPLNPLTKLERKKLQKRLIVKYGPTANDLGLLIATPGSAINGMIQTKPEYSIADLESAISEIVVEKLALASKINATQKNEKIIIEVQNQYFENQNLWIYKIIGTPMASLIASIASELTGSPIIIDSETCTSKNCSIQLRFLEKAP